VLLARNSGIEQRTVELKRYALQRFRRFRLNASRSAALIWRGRDARARTNHEYFVKPTRNTLHRDRHTTRLALHTKKWRK